MHITLEDILASPQAPSLVAEAQKKLEEEARRRAEFRQWLSAGVKAEFIQGEVVVHPPVKRRHSLASEFLFTLLSLFVRLREAGEVRHDKALIALTRNDYEPDICFWKKEKAEAFDDATLIYLPPDWIVEVLSRKTQKTDRTLKLQDYALHGIQEYWIVDPYKKTVEQYGLLTESDTSYLPHGKYSLNEEIGSLTLPDFIIPVRAIFEPEANLKSLSQIMMSTQGKP